MTRAICPTDGTEFEQHCARHVFCQKSCRTRQFQTTVTLVCQYEACQQEFVRRPYDLVNHTGKRAANDGKYCCREHFILAETGQPKDVKRPRQHRTCPVDGTVFEVGGRTAKPKKQQYCSRRCRDRAAYHEGKRSSLLTVDARGWLAGFIDGEGSIMVYWRPGGAFIKLQITNSHKGALEWIAAHTTVGRVCLHRLARKTYKQTWQWLCTGEAAESILQQIEPYLLIKRPQALLALEIQRKLRIPALKADHRWQREVYQHMKALNARGPQPPLQLILVEGQ